MATEIGYNGWTNYETWSVVLWLGNDEGYYRAAVEFVQGCDELTERAVQEFVLDLMPEGTPDFDHRADFLMVNWSELMTDFFTELAEG